MYLSACSVGDPMQRVVANLSFDDAGLPTWTVAEQQAKAEGPGYGGRPGQGVRDGVELPPAPGSPISLLHDEDEVRDDLPPMLLQHLDCSRGDNWGETFCCYVQ
jgi:hypothetical protein